MFYASASSIKRGLSTLNTTGGSKSSHVGTSHLLRFIVIVEFLRLRLFIGGHSQRHNPRQRNALHKLKRRAAG
jgi:hypothetical protein